MASLLRRGLTLFTRVRRNMKSLPISLHDKALLKARNMAETIIGQIKEFSSLNLSKHRSVINAFVHIIAAITALYVTFSRPGHHIQPVAGERVACIPPLALKPVWEI